MSKIVFITGATSGFGKHAFKNLQADAIYFNRTTAWLLLGNQGKQLFPISAAYIDRIPTYFPFENVL